MRSIARISVFSGTALAVALPQPLLACATCFGKSDDLMAQGMNMGIFTLLVVITLVLIGIASVGVFFARRAARLGSENLPSDPNPQLPQSLSQSTH